MAHIPLTQAEIDLCFVPAHEQFARAKARRQRMSCKPMALVVVDVPPVIIESGEATAQPAEPFDNLIIELELLDTDGMKPITSSPDGHKIAKRLMRLCEEKHGLNRGDIPSIRRTNIFVTARDEFINALASLSDWSLPRIGRFVKRDHTTVLHAIQKYTSDPKHAAAYEARKERARASVGRRLADRAERLPKGPRWTPQKDIAVINMLASGMKHSQIAKNLTGNHSSSSVNSRVKRLRARGQL